MGLLKKRDVRSLVFRAMLRESAKVRADERKRIERLLSDMATAYYVNGQLHKVAVVRELIETIERNK